MAAVWFYLLAVAVAVGLCVVAPYTAPVAGLLGLFLLCRMFQAVARAKGWQVWADKV